MAQHLPAEILFHIFTSFTSPDQYLNNLMLVCRDWYQTTNYEMFWLASLKRMMKQQILDCASETLENCITYAYPEYLVIKKNDILKERQHYVSSLKNREKILVVDMKPFTKRKETNDDIYGDSYKTKCIQFIRERRKRLIALEMAKLAITFEQPSLFQDKSEWTQIMKLIENNQFFDKKVVANLGIFNTSTTIFHIFIKQALIHQVIGEEEFFDTVASFFICDCGLNVSTYIEPLIESRKIRSFLKERNNSETFFEKYKNEVKSTAKSGVPAYLLKLIVSRVSMNNESHIEFVGKCVELFKSKKLIKFKESMVEPYTNIYMNALYPNWKNIELYLKDMKLMECNGFDHYEFIDSIIRKGVFFMNEDEHEDLIIELLQRAHQEFGLKLDVPLPMSLTDTRTTKTLKFLVENGVDINYLLPNGTSPLAQFIRHKSNIDAILYLIERGATIPPIETATTINKLDKLFDYISDIDESKFMSTLKILVEKFGPRFSGVAIENLSVVHLSMDNLFALLLLLKQSTHFNEDESTSLALTRFYCKWYNYNGINFDKKEEFRNFVENELGIQLIQAIIDESNIGGEIDEEDEEFLL
ncbi:hypothetical protein NAEGRDRAFT_47593 [Naegleria gruberi]|uniref:F-box domain-containing protein n=1 Tax=Naegleria gruberi TaxID=5762 RepID=D2V8U6_NAEGR|nr:uncharacterized protein NAEGRDRAFT_47593 [Naegleria gruberi]EFC46754.1 hypothetical protein NAEGRDRAFT_47593 [Naegleria gruberi]|eukprot:XP_002679498.1 hypothetical protein NAEGRDRAFT_47593 [Naegleria gruberi strain NEG-M]